jgi:protein-disulfide isomerase
MATATEATDTEAMGDAQGEHALGAAGGLTLVEYGDYTVAGTAQAARLVRLLLRTWGARLRFVYRHFPDVERQAQAVLAAEAAEAAAAQGRFWPMHEALLSLGGRIDDAALVACAAACGLGIERFADEVESGTYRTRVLAQRQRGIDEGVRRAPTFLVGDLVYDGPVDGLAPLIDAALTGELDARHG